MINAITNTHHNINLALSSIVSAKQFLDAKRPLKEVLELVDTGLANIHDAKTEMLKLRETIREQSLEKSNQ